MVSTSRRDFPWNNSDPRFRARLHPGAVAAGIHGLAVSGSARQGRRGDRQSRGARAEEMTMGVERLLAFLARLSEGKW